MSIKIRALIISVLLVAFLRIFVGNVQAAIIFCPGFPFCSGNPFITPTPTSTPTLIPTSTPVLTPVPTVTPIASSSGIMWGAYVGDGVENLSSVDAFESLVGKQLGSILVYQAWEGDWKNFRPQWVTNASSNGSKLIITWEPWNYSNGVNQSRYRLAKITTGNFDTHIRNYAKAAKATNTEFYLRPMHEMNGTWYPWAEKANGNKPGDYVKAWKHLVDIFRSEGATNVKFVWCPNVIYSGSTPLQGLFPGDDYVDMVCMDGYNWGDINGGWQDFTTLFTTTYNQLVALSSHDIMVGETASAEVGGSKADWITNSLGSGIDFLPRIKAINWFNANKEKDWRVNSTPSSLNSFKQAISSNKFN